ncbi:MAG: iron-siderophore ABC transporter substrate-binding protein [Lysinibacillus sp.]|nr:iron-siderophore ABC transporter substrate-binding protein [Lysinibacillus sp.]
MKKLIHFLIFTVFALVLTACSDNSVNESTAVEDVNDNQFPIIIKHAFGETVIDKKPERIATIAWANHDVALALGVVPVGFSAANYGVQDDSGLLPWTAEKLKELGEENPTIYQDTDGLDFEAIANSNPDVILAAYSGITQEEYDTLSQIAPVVPYKKSPWVTPWREQVLLNAKGMGMEEEGKILVAETEKLIVDKAEEYSVIKGKKAAFSMFNLSDLSNFYIYTPKDPRGEFLLDLGMEYPDSLSKLSTDNSFYIEISAENADVLKDTELLITYGSKETVAALQADPILGKIPVIAAGNIVVIEDNTPLAAAGNPNPLSIQYTIDEYLTLISEIAENIE